MYKCKICGNTANNQTMIVREMMFGMREEFEYFKCACCGCLQIAEIPQDMAKYYDSKNYYSYNMQVKTNRTRDLFHKLLFCGFKFGLLPADSQYLRAFPALFHIKKLNRNLRILDVGCGDGRLIQDMAVWGWKNLTGIDPFIESDKIYKINGKSVKVLKQNIFEHNGQYDFIMLHHSFEHLDNQHEVFARLHQLLTNDGRLMIRIPLCDCYVFRKYGVDTFQIDAPRHFFIHTVKSLSFLAKNNGFIIEDIIYDANTGQFIHSEKYCLDIPHMEYKNTVKISKKRAGILKQYTKFLNAIHDGDQACFILKKQ